MQRSFSKGVRGPVGVIARPGAVQCGGEQARLRFFGCRGDAVGHDWMFPAGSQRCEGGRGCGRQFVIVSGNGRVDKQHGYRVACRLGFKGHELPVMCRLPPGDGSQRVTALIGAHHGRIQLCFQKRRLAPGNPDGGV